MTNLELAEKFLEERGRTKAGSHDILGFARWLDAQQVEPTAVVYQPCDKHLGQVFTMQVGVGAAPLVKCPICEPPPMRPMTPFGDSVRNK